MKHNALRLFNFITAALGIFSLPPRSYMGWLHYAVGLIIIISPLDTTRAAQDSHSCHIPPPQGIFLLFFFFLGLE